MKAYNLLGDRFVRLRDAFAQLRRACIRQEALLGPFVLLSITLVRAGLTLMVLCGTYLLLGGELSILVFVLFLVVGSRVFDPLTSALTNFTEFRYFSIAGGRILTLMNEPEMKGERQSPTAGDIRFEHVSFAYQDKEVLHDVTVTLPNNSLTALVGPSGSGKSTVIRAAMGLLKNGGAVTKGEIYYKGGSIARAGEKELRKIRGPEMGMVFQNAGASLCPVRTIEKQLYETVLEHEKTSRQEIRERALEIFKNMGFSKGEEILKSYPFQLSGGMNQRVGIMMAMILKPDLLFADEPTSALDVTVQAQVVKEMMKMREMYGTAIVIVTHNIGLVEHMADKVAVMRQGSLVEYGTREEVTGAPRQEYTKELLSAVLRLNRGQR